MTIRELMDRVAGTDYRWDGLDNAMVRDMGGVPVEMAMLTGLDPRDGRPFLFRLPVERLVKITEGPSDSGRGPSSGA